jgi:hypothetical protein
MDFVPTFTLPYVRPTDICVIIWTPYRRLRYRMVVVSKKTISSLLEQKGFPDWISSGVSEFPYKTTAYFHTVDHCSHFIYYFVVLNVWKHKLCWEINSSIPSHAVILIMWEFPKSLDKLITLLACTLDVFCLNLCRDSDYYYKGLSLFYTVTPVKSGIIPEIKWWKIPYVFLTIWYSLLSCTERR